MIARGIGWSENALGLTVRRRRMTCVISAISTRLTFLLSLPTRFSFAAKQS